MNWGEIIRVIESIVIIICGVKMATYPNEMRWDGKIAKGVFGLLMLLIIVVDAGNTFFFKFSGLGYDTVAIYVFVVLLIFFRIGFWKLFAQNFIYWIIIKYIHYSVINIICAYNRIPFYDYISKMDIPWQGIHIFTMLIMLVLLAWIFYWKREGSLIECKYKRNYVWLSLLAAGAYVILEKIFDGRYVLDVAPREYSALLGAVLLLIISIGIIWAIAQSYARAQHHKQMSEMNLDMLKSQYALLEETYKQKRRTIHDAVQHHILLRQYLDSGQIKEAKEYLDTVMDRMRPKQKYGYTGLDEIDFMLDYKISVAEQLGIQVVAHADVFFNPLGKNDMCILLGNLLDNAIEATKDIDTGIIEISMKTTNNIFLLKVRNPYQGKRKVVEGKYITTKTDEKVHGIGLESVMLMVHRYGGEVEIFDTGDYFEIIVTIYKMGCVA